LIKTKAISVDKYGHYRLGRLNDLIYKQNGRSDAWYDIVSGGNGALPNGQESVAGVGWDSVTGWGTPNWQGFVAAVTPPVNVSATSAQIYSGPPAQGRNATGSAASLAAKDNAFYSVQSVSGSAGQVAAAEMTFTLTGPPSEFDSLNLTLVTNAPSPVTQFVYIYNFQTDQWDAATTSDALMSGVDQTLNISVNMTKYVGPGNVVRIVNRGVLPGRFGSTVYRLNTDQAVLVESF
jgi:hypothetical protein